MSDEKRILYLDCVGGIAGDMTLAALLHLGVPLDYVSQQVELVIPGQVTIAAQSVVTAGIAALRVTVAPTNPDQPTLRHYPEIVGLIKQAGLVPGIAERAAAIFKTLAVAEAKVHGTEPDKVHFHEVGAWDSIADIVGVAAALEHLRIEAVYASSVPLGSGFVQTAHGRLPLPAPATAEILAGIPVCGTDIKAELTTPTGAAILRTLGQGFGCIPPMTVLGTGWGAGHRSLPDRPNMVRAILGRAAGDAAGIGEVLLETNLDDATPELTGHVMGLLLDSGALDVWLTPLVMKKNRPGVKLSTICRLGEADEFRYLILTETTAIGLRETSLRRTTLRREMASVETCFGRAAVKLAYLEGELVNAAPEFDDARRLAAKAGVPVKIVLAEIQAAIRSPDPDW